MQKAGKSATRTAVAAEACAGADLIVTDVWASMGQEEEQKAREVAFADFEVTPELMSLANEDALFMHCLPAHRGEEVSADVIDGPQSVVWEEAGNRLHAQKALLEFLLQ
jgi:ornithine carbamoyltransferase